MVSRAYWQERLTGEDLYRVDGAILKHGNRTKPEIALTFDDGPHPQSVRRILKTLRDAGVPATFFLVGTRIEQHPELVRLIVDQGHEVGNHTEHHYRLTELKPAERIAEIEACDAAFFRATGRHMSLMRPPGMRFDHEAVVETEALGYTTVGWTDAAKDFTSVSNQISGLTPQELARRVMQHVGNGSIILLHDCPQTADALSLVLADLKERGYRFVTAPQMLAHLPHPVFARSNAGPGAMPQLRTAFAR